MKKIVLVILFGVFVLILLVGEISAVSQFKSDWEGVIEEKEPLLEEETIYLREEYELAVAYGNVGKIKKANDIFDKLGDEENWEEELEKVLAAYKVDLEEEPQNIKLLNYLGFSYYLEDEYEKAEELFHKIIELDPKNIWSYNYLAVLQHEQENYRQADKTLRESLKIEENGYTYFLLGINYYRRGNPFKAAYYVGKGREARELFLGD